MILHARTAVLAALLAPLCLNGCSDSSPADDHGHEHGEDGHDHDHGDHADGEHGDDMDHEHEGEPVVLFESTSAGFESLTITHLRTEEIGDELVFVVEVAGAAPEIRGFVRNGAGEESLKVKADMESDGEYHLHIGELPANIELATAEVVVEFERPGLDLLSFDLPLAN